MEAVVFTWCFLLPDRCVCYDLAFCSSCFFLLTTSFFLSSSLITFSFTPFIMYFFWFMPSRISLMTSSLVFSLFGRFLSPLVSFSCCLKRSSTTAFPYYSYIWRICVVCLLWDRIWLIRTPLPSFSAIASIFCKFCCMLSSTSSFSIYVSCLPQ